MTFILWTFVILAFLSAFVALVMPMIPGILMMWVGFFIYHFAINNNELSWFFWIAMATLTIIILISDYVLGSRFVKKFGGSKAGELTAAIGIILGSFFFPPFGIIIIPFVAVFIVELLIQQDFKRAMDASIGSLLGFLTSTLAKFIILIIMIIWFIFDIII
ncbi:DUF456 domain-containing protein [Macrococcus epidermidis]|uniref:DUF456 domain-containing protein n=1 Tax=Macrococcus epidermidis TaxID=1902580 RepID=A0A327ZV18_9STAP|nr:MULTISPECIES: DUF456 family protein [Macrococcus]MCH4985243.1 DUF456 family protein [Macrococcus sp. PK]RAK46045.1 DUF456 domain-containing protein [Macrococcus epidermidis]